VLPVAMQPGRSGEYAEKPVPVRSMTIKYFMGLFRAHGCVNSRRSITADTALRLARYFDMMPQFWMNLQAAYDLDLATRASADRIKRDVHPREAA
jgi:hypothetical protein